MSEIIWVMDSDLCDMCGELLDDWGICPTCGYDGIEWEREEENEDWWYPDDEEDYERTVPNTSGNTGMVRRDLDK